MTLVEDDIWCTDLKQNPQRQADCQAKLASLWSLALGDMQGKLEYIGAADMQSLEISVAGDCQLAVWRGHAELGAEFTVSLRWRDNGNGICCGSLAFSGYHGEKFVEEIHFPIVEKTLSAETRIVFAGRDFGLLNTPENLFQESNTIRMHYSGGMQFAALLEKKNASIYVDHRDPKCQAKAGEFALTADGQNLCYRGVHYVGNDTKPWAEYRLPYENSWGVFQGDWFEAGQIYKKWGTSQNWNRPRAAENPLRRIGMWVWNRGLSQDVLPPVEQLQQDLGNIPVALDWYWWHSNPYDTDYPDFWPPREGEKNFQQALSRLRDRGIFTQAYINGVCWDLDGKSWDEGGAESIVMQRDGQPLAVAFNQYNGHRLGFMCGEAPKFQERIAALVRKLRMSGLDGQYLDMVGCSTYRPCYHPQHRHLKGGGDSGARGYQRLLQRLREENPGLILTTEGCNEAHLDSLDGVIVCNSISGEHMGKSQDFIPLFSSVYHGKMALFGNYAHPDGITPWDPLWPPEDRWKEEKAWHRLYPEQFYLELARTLISGAQPMVCNLSLQACTDPEFASIYRFILATARFYYEHRDFLFDGQMLSPAGFACHRRHVDFMARMIFTKESQCRVVSKTLPAILHSCWQAPDRRRALFLANYTNELQSWSFGENSGELAAHAYLHLPY